MKEGNGLGCLQMEEEALARREKKEILIWLTIFKQREKGEKKRAGRLAAANFQVKVSQA